MWLCSLVLLGTLTLSAAVRYNDDMDDKLRVNDEMNDKMRVNDGVDETSGGECPNAPGGDVGMLDSWTRRGGNCKRCKGVRSKTSTAKDNLAHCLGDAGSAAYVSWDALNKLCQATDTCDEPEDTSNWWYPKPWRIFFQPPKTALVGDDASWDKAGEVSRITLRADPQFNVAACEDWKKCKSSCGIDPCECAATKETYETMHLVPQATTGHQSSLQWVDHWPSDWAVETDGYSVAFVTEYCGDIHWSAFTQHCLLVLELRKPNVLEGIWFLVEQEGFQCGVRSGGCRYVYPSDSSGHCPAKLIMKKMLVGDGSGQNDLAAFYSEALYDPQYANQIKSTVEDVQIELGKELVDLSSMRSKFRGACGERACFLKVNHARRQVHEAISIVGIRKWTATFANTNSQYAATSTNCQMYATDLYNELTGSDEVYRNGILMGAGRLFGIG